MIPVLAVAAKNIKSVAEPINKLKNMAGNGQTVVDIKSIFRSGKMLSDWKKDLENLKMRLADLRVSL